MAVGQFYTLKLYDKGKQAGTLEADLMRLEIHASKMEHLKPYGLATLADLTDAAKVADLGDVLQKAFAGVLCYDGSINGTQLTERERLFLEQCKNPLFWLNLGKDVRYRTRQRFADLLARFGANIAYQKNARKGGRNVAANAWRGAAKPRRINR